MDFLSFFGLKEDPFKLTPDPAYFYPSSTHHEGLLLLDYSIEQKEGFTTVIGDPGSGKTTLLNVFLEKWKDRAEIAIILTPRLSPEEFLISILEDLKIGPRRKSKNEIIKAFRDFMIEKSSEGRWVIIIVDEAQNLPDETLEELRLLSNLETDKDKLLQIVLLGQPELETKLMSEQLRQLNQRITTRIYLRHFNPDETQDYINYRVIKAGKQNLQLDKKAGKLACKLSKGVPRLINMLISRALMAAYLEESNIILPRHILHAVKSLNHNEMKVQNWLRFAPLTGGIAGALLLTVFTINSYRHNAEAPKAPLKTAAVSNINIPVEPVVLSQKNENIKSITPSLQKKEPVASPSEKVSRAVTETRQEQKASKSEPVAAETMQAPAYKLVSVKVDIANLRDNPYQDAEVVGKVFSSAYLVALQEYLDENNTKWYQVLYRGEKRWIAEDVVEVVDLEEKSGNKVPAN